MAKYRVISPSGAYMVRSPEIVRLELGADANAAKAYGVRSQVYELLAEGAEIEGDHIAFGPHLEALDESAQLTAAAYWKAKPGATLDPTRSLPLGQDPMLQPTFEQAMLRNLERIAADQSSVVRVQGSDSKLDALTEAMTKLAGMVAMLVPPTRKAA
jgi:hypothetical protein